MLRGGSWNNNNPGNLLSSNRKNNPPENRDNNCGFRVVCVSAPKVSETNGRDAPWATCLPRQLVACSEAWL